MLRGEHSKKREQKGGEFGASRLQKEPCGQNI